MKPELKIFIAAAVAICVVSALVFVYVPIDPLVEPPAQKAVTQITNNATLSDFWPDIHGDHVVFVRGNPADLNTWEMWAYNIVNQTEWRISTTAPYGGHNLPPRIHGNTVVWSDGWVWLNMYNLATGVESSLKLTMPWRAIHGYDIEYNWVVYSQRNAADNGYDIIKYNIDTSAYTTIMNVIQPYYNWAQTSVSIHNGRAVWGNNILYPNSTVESYLYWSPIAATNITSLDITGTYVTPRYFDLYRNVTGFHDISSGRPSWLWDDELPITFALGTFMQPNTLRLDDYFATFVVNYRVYVYNQLSNDYYQVPHVSLTWPSSLVGASHSLGMHGGNLVVSGDDGDGTYNLYLWRDIAVPPDTGSIGDADQPPPIQSWVWLVIAVAVIITALGIAAWSWSRRDGGGEQPPEMGYGSYRQQPPQHHQRGKRG